MKITLWNKHHGEPPKDKGNPFYIGRGSPLGNPYTHLPTKLPGTVKVRTRDEAVELYRTWLEEKYQAGDRKVMDELHRIFEAAEQGPIQLVCFCAPHRCHGEVIRQLMLDNATEKES